MRKTNNQTNVEINFKTKMKANKNRKQTNSECDKDVGVKGISDITVDGRFHFSSSSMCCFCFCSCVFCFYLITDEQVSK